MPQFLSTTDPGFEAAFRAFLARKREVDEDVDAAVADIIADVRARGDRALIDLTARFDRVTLTPHTLRVPDAEIDALAARVPEAERKALTLAAERIRAYHDRQMPDDALWEDEAGVTLGWRWRPVAAAGLYVPGGTAAYPSSVLMNAIPAKVAGVGRLVVTVPAPGGVLNPLVMLACRIAGVDEIWRIGGAQAVAALAWGTAAIAPVDKIVGPGNAYVAEAKRQVFGRVGIDSIAGPSEVLILADEAADPALLAWDLMAQAEHDEAAQALLITPSAALAEAVDKAVAALIPTLPRAAIAGESWRRHGAIILVRDWAEAALLADRIAPEHLQIATADPAALFARIRHAGAAFLGVDCPEALGDYVAGPNHVLPTGRTARFASGLSVFDFLKRTTWVEASAEGLAAIGPAAVTLAGAEGLDAHARSVAARLPDPGA